MSSASLTPFIALAKTTSGRAVSDVIMRALKAKDTYVFGELLDVSSVAALASSDPKTYKLLELFAFGTYADYKGVLLRIVSRCK
jgi:hypothetical protein